MIRAVAVTAWYGPFDARTPRINPWVKVDITPRWLCCSSQAHTMHHLLKVIFDAVVCFPCTHKFCGQISNNGKNEAQENA